MKQRTMKLINLTSDLIDHYQSADAIFESEHTVAQELQTSYQRSGMKYVSKLRDHNNIKSTKK
jgi:hypothetical protein